MRDCTMGRVWKILAVVILLVQETIYLLAAIAGAALWSVILQMLLALLWPALLWGIGEMLDRQEVQGQKLERILELLGEEPEEPEEDLTRLEARLEEALESGEEPEWTQEEE